MRATGVLRLSFVKSHNVEARPPTFRRELVHPRLYSAIEPPPAPVTMPSADREDYEPKNAVTEAGKGALTIGGGGLFAAALVNALAKQNLGPWAIFTRTGGMIGTFGASLDVPRCPRGLVALTIRGNSRGRRCVRILEACLGESATKRRCPQHGPRRLPVRRHPGSTRYMASSSPLKEERSLV